MSRLGRTLRIIPVLLPIAVLLPFLGVARGAPSVSSLHRAFFNAPSTLQPEQPPTHPDRAKQQEPLNVELIVIGFTPGSTPYRPGDTVMGVFRIWNHEGVDLSKVTLNLYYSANKLSLADCDPMPGLQTARESLSAE